MSFSSVGRVWDTESFVDYVEDLPSLGWASSVTVHHTAFPDLSMRPQGWKIQHMRNLAHYYGKERKWSAGPHLFTDEDQIFGMTPLTERGVHAVSFNRSSIGIEMLGNFNHEDPDSGRGKQVVAVTVAAVAILLKKLGLPANEKTVLFHRDDPKTKKSCPGSRISKGGFVDAVSALIEDRGEPSKIEQEPDRAKILERLAAAEWQIEKIREELGKHSN